MPKWTLSASLKDVLLYDLILTSSARMLALTGLGPWTRGMRALEGNLALRTGQGFQGVLRLLVSTLHQIRGRRTPAVKNTDVLLLHQICCIAVHYVGIF